MMKRILIKRVMGFMLCMALVLNMLPITSFTALAAEASGDAADKSNAGGIVGAMESTDVTITDCGNTGSTVTGTVQVTVGESVTYYADMDAANTYIGTLEGTDPISIVLLDNMEMGGRFTFAGKTIELDLNGKTLTVGELQYAEGADVTVKDSDEGGKITVKIDHYVNANRTLTIESGSIEVSGNYPGVYVEGTFHMTGGMLTGSNCGINVQSSEASVTVSGGTVDGGNGYAFDNVSGDVNKISLSGGTYVGGIAAGDGYSVEGILSDIMGNGYTIEDENGELVSMNSFLVDGTVKVVCAHTLEHEDNKPATCQTLAYCGKCNQTYGELSTDHTYNATTGRCECGAQAPVQVTVGEVVTYYGGMDAANTYIGDLEGTDPISIVLLDDTEAAGVYRRFTFAAKTIELDLNGKTLIVGELQYADGADVTVKDSAEGGKITVKVDHCVNEKGTLTLESGSIEVSGNYSGVYVYGTFRMTGGMLTGSNCGIDVQVTEASVTVSGGTVNGGSGYAFDTVSGDVNKISLSGGIYVGGIAAGDGDFSYVRLSNIMENGCTIEDENGEPVSMDSYFVDGTVKVVCPHTQGNTTNATCTTKAICGTCGKEHGELDSDAHTYNAKTGLCECGAQAAARVGDSCYSTFEEAVAVWQEGATLILMDNVTLNATQNLSENTSRKLEMNGFSITCDSGSIFVLSNGTLTLQGDLETNLISGNGNAMIKVSGGTLSLAGDTKCDGLTIENATGSNMELTLPENYYLIDSSGERVTTIANGTIATVRREHEHNWNFSANGATITAVCDSTIGICPDTEQSITIEAPTNLIYDGTVKRAAISGAIDGVTNPDIHYDGDSVNAGSHKADITLGNATASVTYSIEAAAISTAVVSVDSTIDRIYSGKEIKPEVTVVFDNRQLNRNTDYNVSYTNNINAGTATVIVEGKGNYQGRADAAFEITKATAPAATVDKSYVYARENADTIALAALLPSDCGNVTYGEPIVSENGMFSKAPAVSDGRLSYTVKSGNIDETGKITVVATTQNYKDITIIVNVKLMNQISVHLKENTEVSLKNDSITYGQKLSNLEFMEAAFVGGDGKTVAGTLAWKNTDEKFNAGTTSAMWLFTPDDNTYATLEGDITISVNKAPNTPNMPDSTMTVPYDTKIVDDVELPENWTWQENAVNTVLEEGVPIQVNVTKLRLI